MTVFFAPPVGVVALLFTDIEGSTGLARALGEDWGSVLERHHDILGEAITDHDGWLDGTEGDAFFATFADPCAAAGAAVAAMHRLREEVWPAAVGELRVRMGLHVGWISRTRTGYVGLEVHRAARIAAAAHGGQLLVSARARQAVGDTLSVNDLGLHRLKDFPAPEHLYCAVIDGRGADDFPPPRTLDIRPTNLSSTPGALVGRAADVRAVGDLLASYRLVTIVGRGGSGKTSLGRAVASEQLERSRGGVWWVSLATVNDPQEVLGQVAAVVRADPAGRMPLHEALVARLDGEPTLLVLDNVEQLVAAAPDIETLLAQLPNLRVLATSQIALGVAGESVFALATLGPSAARELFLDRAEKVRTGLSLEAEDSAAVDDICAHLDGLPLAIELAAGRLSVLTPVQLRDRLAASPDLLQRGGLTSGLERHRSLRETVDWSLGLLDASSRALFTQMAVFARAASLESLEAVARSGDINVVDALDGLLGLALVRRTEEAEGVIRFELPEALRQIACDSLDRDPAADPTRRRHAEHVISVLEAARLFDTCTEAQYAAAVRLDADAALALSWAVRADPGLACVLAGLWSLRLLEDGHARAAQHPLAVVEATHRAPAQAKAHAQLARAQAAKLRGELASALRDFDVVCSHLEDSDPDLVPGALATRGTVRAFLGDVAGGLDDCSQAITRARAAGRPGWGGVLLTAAQVYAQAGRHERARDLVEEFAALSEQYPTLATRDLENLRGDVERAAGLPRQATFHYLRSLTLAVASRDDMQVFYDLCNLSTSLMQAEEFAAGLEISGLARAVATEHFGAPEFTDTVIGPEYLQASRRSLGADRAAATEAAGMATVPGQRPLRASELVGHAWLGPREAGGAR